MPDAGDTIVTATPTPPPEPTPATSTATVPTTSEPANVTDVPTTTALVPSAGRPAPGAQTTDQQVTAKVPKPPNWGANVYNHILSALGGTDNVTYQRNPDTGKMEPVRTPKSPGQQWKTIIAGALAGIGNMGDAGVGPGRLGRSFSAGVQGGMKRAQTEQATARQQANEDWELQQKLLTDTAQRTMLTTQNTAMQQRMAREGVDAIYADAKHAQEFAQYVQDSGGEFVGRAANFDELMKLHQGDKSLMQAHGQGLLVANPVIENGKYVATEFYKITPQWLKQKINSERTIDFLKRDPNDPSKFTISTEHIDANSMTNEDYLKTKNGQDAVIEKAEDDAAKQKLAESELKVRQQTAASEINKNYAEADDARERAAQIRTQRANVAGDLETLAQAMYSGQLTKADVQARGAAGGVSLNAIMARALEIGQQNGKPFSEEQIKMEEDFAKQPKLQAVMDGIDRVVGTPAMAGQPAIPGQIDMMLKYAAQTGLSDMAPLNQVVQSVKQQFGDEAAKNFQTAIGETQRVVGGLVGNPLLGGGETDARLAQGAKMFGENPTLKNLKSTGQVMKKILTQQRDSYTRNNRYLRQRWGGESVTGDGTTGGPTTGTVSISAAMQLPQNKGKSRADVQKDIEAHGHTAVD